MLWQSEGRARTEHLLLCNRLGRVLREPLTGRSTLLYQGSICLCAAALLQKAQPMWSAVPLLRASEVREARHMAARLQLSMAGRFLTSTPSLCTPSTNGLLHRLAFTSQIIEKSDKVQKLAYLAQN